MKQSAKILVAALAASCLLAGAVSLAACNEEQSPHAHVYGEWEITAPTITAKGSAKKTCTGCEEGTEGHEVTVTLPELSDDGYTVTGDTATCTAGGEATYTITVEDNEVSFKVATPAKAHEYELHTATPATCTVAGNKRYYTCKNCNTYFNDRMEVCDENDHVLPAAHTYGAWEITDPTEDGTGSAKKTCTVCAAGTEGHEITLTLPSLSDGDYAVTGDTATCTDAGEATYSVTVDGVDISFSMATKAKGHTLGALHEAVEATCENAGNPAYYECNVCHSYFSDEDGAAEHKLDSIVIPAAHQYVEHAAESATCQKAGNSKYYSCSKCERYFDESKVECEEDDWVIPQIEHTKELLQDHYTPAQINVNYCTQPFEVEHWYCTMCEKNYDANMEPLETLQHDPLGHDFEGVEQTPAVAATCTADGMPAYYECNRCHEHYLSNDTASTNTTTAKAIPSTGHHWVSDGELGDPVPEGGKINVRCTNENCGVSQQIDYSGTLALTGTNAATAVSIESAGQYYIKGTAATNIWFSIPITKAGTYRVDFINLDASKTIGFLSTQAGTVQVYDQAGTKKMYGRYQGSFKELQPSSDGSLTGEIGQAGSMAEFRWFELKASETLVGGKIVFIIMLRNATADSPFPVVIDVKITDAAAASISAQEYAVLPGKYALSEDPAPLA